MYSELIISWVATNLQDVMQAAGVALVLIGPGSVDQAKAFSEQTKFKGDVYADPTHSSYDALEFTFGLFSTFTPAVTLAILFCMLNSLCYPTYT